MDGDTYQKTGHHHLLSCDDYTTVPSICKSPRVTEKLREKLHPTDLMITQHMVIP